MILPIYVNGADILRRECVEVEAVTNDLKVLIANMFDTMEGADGVGLAAPQVGQAIRLFVVDLTDYETDEQDEVQNLNPELGRGVFINPRIVDSSEETCAYKEGCLSVPGINETVSRPERVTIEYLDEDLKPQSGTFGGMWGRVIQHEHDHLEGRLFVDSVAQIRRQMIKSKLDAMARGKYKAHYKTRK